MKTVIDAVNEFKAELFEDYVFESLTNERYWPEGYLIISEVNPDSTAFVSVCDKEKFNEMVSKMSRHAGKLLYKRYVRSSKKPLSKELEVMTPLAIAHKALKGGLNNSYKYIEYDNDKFLHLHDDGDYCTFDRLEVGNLLTYISTVEEFNNFKPIDTRTDKQKAIDDLFKLDESICNNTKWHENFIDAIIEGKIRGVSFKPLTSLVELIDGKAYQFDYVRSGEVAGVYDEDKNCFYGVGKYCYVVMDCTNIQLLTVKNKND